jgi:Flp pilus assembly pilin Flp
MDGTRALIRRVIEDERGMNGLERFGLFAAVVSILVFIPAVRSVLGELFDATLGQVDDEGNLTGTAIALRGILITIIAILSFIGTGFLLLYTDLGKRLAFLVTGAATFGWMVIGSMLFVVYAPRGLRPANLQGLNAFQIRIPAISLTLASLILFLMFVAALDRFDKEEAEV